MNNVEVPTMLEMHVTLQIEKIHLFLCALYKYGPCAWQLINIFLLQIGLGHAFIEKNKFATCLMLRTKQWQSQSQSLHLKILQGINTSRLMFFFFLKIIATIVRTTLTCW